MSATQFDRSTQFFVGAIITSVLGGLLLIIGDFVGWYHSVYRVSREWGWVGFFALLESGNLISMVGSLLFLGLASGLFFCAIISGLILKDPDAPPEKTIITYAFYSAIAVTAVTLVGGIIAVVLFLADEPNEWWFDLAFWGGLIGGGLTTLFFWLGIQEMEK
ncbi:MAG: hypothetical protein ACXACP_03390 [Candidatus Hodarchaeales archaeon]